ncbi:MAG: hypothetical protein PWR27_165 [Petroclostridium sp.]|uniref:hypothetical protein n=1 Tax=Petroclostridium xylanilyticum TaxID=1792311 RepID=UPI000B98A748|nr:hypothetical protein [Petroclostridium xylanilyticum]MBZ4646623.1 hypothetical protein [Clostridia bacterium]MDK2809456.1 hypothetical protein [Petroclostridium sp.]
MNCHGNHNHKGNNGEHNHKGHMSHMWLMILCCAIPLVLLLLLPLLKINNPAIQGLLSGAVFFLCPLMHLFMLPMMFRKDKNKEENHNHHLNNQIEARNQEG